MMDKNCTAEEFNTQIWKTFSKAVRAKKYTKMDYSTWCTIQSWIRDNKEIQIYTTPGAIGVSTRDIIHIEAFSVDDNSFGSYLNDYLTKIENTITNNNVKENNDMMKNFEFGPVNGDTVRMSMYGLAVKNASGTWVAYDAANKRMMDVDILNFKGADRFMYKMPVAIKDIAVGDTIVHGRKPLFVVAVRNDGKLACVDPIEGEERVILVSHSPFGFNFVTKVVSLLNISTANAENPFGNMLPLLLMSDNDDFDPLMLMAMNGNMNNPLMMYALMKNSDNNDMLPLLMMSGVFGGSPLLQIGNGGACAETSKE